jgi:hypothetical protein
MVSAQQGYESGKAPVMQNSSILKITSKSPVICINVDPSVPGRTV